MPLQLDMLRTAILLLAAYFFCACATEEGYNCTLPTPVDPPEFRFYPNDQPDYQPGDACSLPADLRTALLEASRNYLEQLIHCAPPNSFDSADVFEGSAGPALLFFKGYLRTNDAYFLKLAKKYIDAAVPVAKNSTDDEYDGFLWGQTGVFVVAAAIYHADGDKRKAKEMISIVQESLDSCKQGDLDDLDGGKAGLLYAGLLLNSHFGSEVISSASLNRLADMLIENGFRIGDRSGVLKWHGPIDPEVVFWGQTHGTAGVLQVLLELPHCLHNTTVRSLIVNTLDDLAARQLPSGNFPTPLVAPYPMEEDQLVQFDHGAPGVGVVMAKAYQVFGTPLYRESAEKAFDCVWERGILSKGQMLCHGVQGNAYMLLHAGAWIAQRDARPLLTHQTDSAGTPPATAIHPKFCVRALRFQEKVLRTPALSKIGTMRTPTPVPYGLFQSSFLPALSLWLDILHMESAMPSMPGFGLRF